MRKTRIVAALVAALMLCGVAIASATSLVTPTPPAAPRLDLHPVACAGPGCDPRRLSGAVVAFDGTRLTERTKDGHTYTALVDAKTNVACPPREAIAGGRVFNPVPPSPPQFGAAPPPAPPAVQLKDRYACSADEIVAGRRVVGAALGRDASGRLRWIGVALAPR